MSKNQDDFDPNNPVDEWGDPIKARPQNNAGPFVDEWGDPVKYVRSNQTPEEFLSEKQKLANERVLIEQGVIYPRSHYLPRGRFRGILAVCLAFLFGLFICLGALVGVGAWAGTRAKIRQLLGANTDKFVNPEYADMSVLDFVSAVIGDLQGGIHTLDDIAKFTPMVDTILDTLGENTAALGIELTDDLRAQLKSTPFNGIGAFLMDDVLKTVELGKVMDVTPSSDAMMVGLCYGEEDLDYTIGEDNTFVHIEGGREPTTIGMLMDNPTDLLSTMRLGTLMGLNKDVTESDLSDNAMMYSLCYGKRGTDYEVVDGKIKVLSDQKPEGNSSLADEQEAEGGQGTGESYVHTFPTTLDALMNHSNAVINSLELGTMLGIDSDVDEKKIKDNGVMYSLAYGSRGTDWELEGNKIVMLDGHGADYPTKMQSFTEDSSALIQGMEVETLMSIELSSDKLMHYLAYGPEMAKGKAFVSEDPEAPVAPWKFENGKYYDADHQPVDENGYLLDPETNWYPTEEVEVTEENDQGVEVTTTKTQYKDGATFIYEYEKDENGQFTLDTEGNRVISGIMMLPDPNAEGFDPTNKDTWKPYSKKKVSNLTGEDANIIEGMKIGDAMEINSESSALMQAMKDWTIEDLSDQDMIESLKLSDVLGEDSNSKIMQALADKTLAEMKEQETIDNLKLSDVLEINNDSSGIIQAMESWKLEDLSDQNHINRLKIGNVVNIDGNSSGIMQAMQTWSLNELTDQDKINTLTLGDVMEITEPEGILHALADCPIGSMQARVDTLTLTEILGADSIAENKILKHLANSTVDTLADDMEVLPIGKVFADEMFSFMEIKTDTENIFKDITGKQDGSGKITYQVLYNNYLKNHADAKYNFTNGVDNDGTPLTFSQNSYLPHPYKIQDEPIKASEVTTYYVLKGTTTVAVPTYYLSMTGSDIVPEGTEVKTDAGIVRDNRDNSKQERTPYYFEEKIKLTPEYTYMVYNYKSGAAEPLPSGDEVISKEVEGEQKLYYKTASGEEYPIKKDNFSLYYEHDVTTPPAEEGGESKTETVRVDLDYVITSYVDEISKTPYNFVTTGDETDKSHLTANGKTYELRHKKAEVNSEGHETEPAYDYVIERTDVYLSYTANGTRHTLDELEERYRYEKEGQDPVELDRYLEGVWFLLLAHENEPTVSGSAGTITYDASKPILDMDGLITDINDTMTETTLWKLYFHGMLEDNPYYSFSQFKWLKGKDGNGDYTIEGAVTFVGSDNKETTVSNLNDVKISQVVALVTGIFEQVDETMKKAAGA